MFVGSALAMSVAAANVELYSDKYDYVDVDQILANDRLRDQYYDCFIGYKPCTTPDSKFFGGILKILIRGTIYDSKSIRLLSPLVVHSVCSLHFRFVFLVFFT